MFVPILILVLCWLALRYDGGDPASQGQSRAGVEPDVQAQAQETGPGEQSDVATATQLSSADAIPPPSEAEEEKKITPSPVEQEADFRNLTGQPLSSDFLEKAVQGNMVRITLPDNSSIAAEIRHLERDDDGVLVVEASFENPEPGQLLIQRQTAPGVLGPFVGHVLFDRKDEAWKIEPTKDQTEARFVASSIDDIICRGIAMPPEDLEESGDPEFAPQDHPSDIPIPDYQSIIPLQSLPGATGVIYLDFDGEEGPFTGWGDFDAEPANASNAQIYDIWKRVSEDFQGFNLNITTDRKVFEAAPDGRRQQVIITPTKDASPDAGGVAYLNTYNWTNPRVCWAFIQRGKSAAEVISHEVGHTLRLRHHGRSSPQEEYYSGHGSGEVAWGPIMGTSYSKNLSQWSKGEYLNANRSSQDDLAIITTNNPKKMS